MHIKLCRFYKLIKIKASLSSPLGTEKGARMGQGSNREIHPDSLSWTSDAGTEKGASINSEFPEIEPKKAWRSIPLEPEERDQGLKEEQP